MPLVQRTNYSDQSETDRGIGMSTMMRSLATCVIVAALLVIGALGGCGGAAVDRRAEVSQLWAADPGSADWDMTIRGVVAGEKSTGEHMSPATIYLTTFTSKTVPGFSVYQTIDVFNDDSMGLENRVAAYFTALTSGSYFPAVQDIEGFMQWYATDMQGKYFLSLYSITDEKGKNTWNLIVSDTEPVSSTMAQGYPKTEIPLAFDEATGAWSVK
jgi:hypothetical protein